MRPNRGINLANGNQLTDSILLSFGRVPDSEMDGSIVYRGYHVK